VGLKAESAPRLGVGSFDDDDAVEPVVGQDSDGNRDALAVEAVGAMELRVLAEDPSTRSARDRSSSSMKARSASMDMVAASGSWSSS
jgi:hypothetical protein